MTSLKKTHMMITIEEEKKSQEEEEVQMLHLEGGSKTTGNLSTITVRIEGKGTQRGQDTMMMMIDWFEILNHNNN